MVATPHLGASTNEAQENVALQVAEQMADYLLTGAVTNALNMPSVSAEDAPKLKPYITMAENLGTFAGQITEGAIQSVSMEYFGQVASLNVKPLSNTILMGLLQPILDTVNMVNAPAIAKDRNIAVSETRHERESGYQTLIRLKVQTEKGVLQLAGSLFSAKPRLVAIDDVTLEAELTPHMLFVRNEDKPGFIGRLGTTIGENKINIANFTLGRNAPGQNAVCLVAVDQEIPARLLETIKAMPGVVDAYTLHFNA